MKPRPTASKSKRDDSKPEVTAKAPEVRTRTIFVKDPGQSIEGFGTYEEAVAERRKFGEDSDDRRIRVRYRSRTDRWDLLVKVAKRVPIDEQKEIGE